MANTSFDKITYRKDLSNYLINRKGEIYSNNKHRVLTPQVNEYGYYQYVLTTDDGKKVRILAHVAVASQYIKNSDLDDKIIVNHIDENKQNPSVDNLEWVTIKENVNHGTCIKRSSDHRKKPVNEYDLDGHYIRTWSSVRDVTLFFGDYFNKTLKEMKSAENSIYGCLRGVSKSSMNRIWRYYRGGTKDIDVPKVSGNMPIGITCSHSKMRFDYDVDIPDEYLYHKMSADDIYNYFIHLDKLTNYEKQMIEELKSL